MLERAVKAVRAQGRPRLTEQSPPSNSAVANTGKRSLKHDSVRHPVKAKQNDGIVTAFEPHIVDEGPKADWVKINVHKHVSPITCLVFSRCLTAFWQLYLHTHFFVNQVTIEAG